MSDIRPIERVQPKIQPYYKNVRCTRCRKFVRMAFDRHMPSTQAQTLQPLDGLHLVNHYGYGMWRDDMGPEGGDSYRDIVVCGECTPGFFEDNPWLKEYLEV